MNRTIPVILALGLAGCSAAQQAQVTTTLATAQADAQKVIYYWGVIKGMALVAEASQPSLVAVLAPRIAAIDSLVAQATAAITTVQGDVVTIEAIVTQITSQAQAVASQAAPAIKVVANGK